MTKLPKKLFYKKSEPMSTSYVAGVVEVAVSNETDADEFLASNAKIYIDIIKSNETANVDVLVFPEATLNKPTNPATVPKKGEKVIPCDSNQFSPIVKNISCAAKESKKYVVINLYMERNCKEEAAATKDTRPCTRGEINVYNTALAFDRTGTVVAM